MLQNSPSSVGTQAVRKAYDAVFDAIKLNVKFDIAEIRQLAPNWGFARTNSAGRVKVNATGESNAEGNQELFVFQKIGGDWKIARYCFSTTNRRRCRSAPSRFFTSLSSASTRPVTAPLRSPSTSVILRFELGTAFSRSSRNALALTGTARKASDGAARTCASPAR